MGLAQELKAGFHEIPLWGWGALAAGGLLLYIYESRKKAAQAAQGAVSTGSTLNVPMVPANSGDQSYIPSVLNYMGGQASQYAQQFQDLQQAIADETALIAGMQQQAGQQGAGQVTPPAPTPTPDPIPVFNPSPTAPPVPVYEAPPAPAPYVPAYDPNQYADNLALLNSVNPGNAANLLPPPPPPPTVPYYPALQYNNPPPVSPPITPYTPAVPVAPPIVVSTPTTYGGTIGGTQVSVPTLAGSLQTVNGGSYTPPFATISSTPFVSGFAGNMTSIMGPPPAPFARLA